MRKREAIRVSDDSHLAEGTAIEADTAAEADTETEADTGTEEAAEEILEAAETTGRIQPLRITVWSFAKPFFLIIYAPFFAVHSE